VVSELSICFCFPADNDRKGLLSELGDPFEGLFLQKLRVPRDLNLAQTFDHRHTTFERVDELAQMTNLIGWVGVLLSHGVPVRSSPGYEKSLPGQEILHPNDTSCALDRTVHNRTVEAPVL
jgi:hypothetical protein